MPKIKRNYDTDDISGVQRIADISAANAVRQEEANIRSVNADGSLQVQILGSNRYVTALASKDVKYQAGQTVIIHRSDVNGRWSVQGSYNTGAGSILITDGVGTATDTTALPPVNLTVLGGQGFIYAKWEPSLDDKVFYYEVEVSDTVTTDITSGLNPVRYKVEGTFYIVSVDLSTVTQKFFRVRTINNDNAVSDWSTCLGAYSIIDPVSPTILYEVNAISSIDRTDSVATYIILDEVDPNGLEAGDVDSHFIFTPPITGVYYFNTFGNLNIIVTSGEYQYVLDVVIDDTIALVYRAIDIDVPVTPGANYNLAATFPLYLIADVPISLRINIGEISAGSMQYTISDGSGVNIQWYSPRQMRYHRRVLVPNGSSEIVYQGCLQGDVIHALYLTVEDVFSSTDRISFGVDGTPELLATQDDFILDEVDRQFAPVNYQFDADADLKIFVSNDGSDKYIKVGLDIK